MIYDRTKHIPVSHVYLRKLVPWIYPCQRIHMLVHTKDMLMVGVCQNVKLMALAINLDWKSLVE